MVDDPDMPVRAMLHCPDRATALAIAEALLDARLVAAANLLPEIESFYVWKGARVARSEWPLQLATRAGCMAAIARHIARLHPYELAPLCAVPLVAVAPASARWIAETTLLPTACCDAAATGDEN